MSRPADRGEISYHTFDGEAIIAGAAVFLITRTKFVDSRNMSEELKDWLSDRRT